MNIDVGYWVTRGIDFQLQMSVSPDVFCNRCSFEIGGLSMKMSREWWRFYGLDIVRL